MNREFEAACSVGSSSKEVVVETHQSVSEGDDNLDELISAMSRLGLHDLGPSDQWRHSLPPPPPPEPTKSQMAVNQELEAACSVGPSTGEVVEILHKHQSLPEGYYSHITGEFLNSREPFDARNAETWDNWKPLAAHLKVFWCIDPSIYLPHLGDPILNTRKALRGKFISWLCDVKRDRNPFWISESLGFSQTLGELGPTRDSLKTLMTICAEIHRFGAYFRHWGLYDVVTTLVAQLAAHYPPYRFLLARALIDNPNLLNKPTRFRFKKLIIAPWKALQISHPRYVTMPPVIFLDHFHSDPNESLSEVLEVIGQYSYPTHRSPLLWVVRSYDIGQPLKQLLGEFIVPIPPKYVELSLDDDEIPGDTELILRHTFNEFCEEHKEMFDADEVWPSEEHMSRLVDIISGVLDFVDVLLRFINCGGSQGPRAQLETFLTYMDNYPLPWDLHPYCALDHFHSQALSAVPRDILPDVINIAECFSRIYVLILKPIPRHIAHLLDLEQARFSRAFTHLQWAAVEGEIQSDFARYCSLDPLFMQFLAEQSGEFSLSPSKLLGVRMFLRALDHSQSFIAALKATKWTPTGPLESIDAAHRLIASALWNVWWLPFRAKPEDVAALYSSFYHFDFRCLVYRNKIILPHFIKFLQWLYPLGQKDSPNLVRTAPAGPSDRQFIAKCRRISEPLDLENKEMLLPIIPRYVLLGFGAQTVLVLLAALETDEGEYLTHGVSIYSLEMLDDL